MEIITSTTPSTPPSYHPALLTAGASAFIALVLPCFLRLTSSSGALYQGEGFLALMPATLISGITAAALLILGGALGLLKIKLSPLFVRISAVCFFVGCLPWPLSLLVVLPLELIYLGGLSFGVGTALCSLVWALLVGTKDFRMLVRGCALATLVALGIVSGLNSIAALPAALTTVLLGVLALALPVHASTKGAIPFARHEQDEPVKTETKRQLESSTQNQTAVFPQQISLAELLAMIGLPVLGLMLFVILSTSQQHNAGFSALSTTTVNLAIAAAVFLLASCFKWRRPVLPLINWVVFPLVASILLVLDSFPVESNSFMMGALGVYFFCSLLGLFSLSFLLTIIGQGEYSPVFLVGISLLLIFITALAGHLLFYYGPDEFSRGQIMLSVTTLYFVCLIISPALQLWRARQDRLEEDPPKASAADSFLQICADLASRYKLSAREREIFDYLSRGYNSPYIASALFISESTVRSHIKNIYKKLRINSRTDIIRLVEEEQQKP